MPSFLPASVYTEAGAGHPPQIIIVAVETIAVTVTSMTVAEDIPGEAPQEKGIPMSEQLLIDTSWPVLARLVPSKTCIRRTCNMQYSKFSFSDKEKSDLIRLGQACDKGLQGCRKPRQSHCSAHIAGPPDVQGMKGGRRGVEVQTGAMQKGPAMMKDRILAISRLQMIHQQWEQF